MYLTTSVSTIDALPFNIYPNPAKNIVSIRIENNGNYKVEIYNGYGKVLLEDSLTSLHKTIEISTLPTGVYLVRISNEKSEYSIRKLVVID